jgi:hypothetical protein
LKMSSLPTLALRSPIIFIWYLRKFIEYMFYFFVEPVLYIISFILWSYAPFIW